MDHEFLGTVVAITDLIASRWFVKVKRLRELITLAMILISFVVGLTMVTHVRLSTIYDQDSLKDRKMIIFK